MFDYHVHTTFSPDSAMRMEVACKQAIEKGLKEIAFTEHLDYFYPNCPLLFTFDYGEYANAVDKAREHFGSQLTILKGVEVGLHPQSYDRSKAFTDDNAFDFIIGSVHIVKDFDMHNGDYFKDRELHDAILSYFEVVNQYVKEYTDFNVLGHITLVKRYLYYLNTHWTDVKWDKYYDIAEDTFKHLIHTGRGIEVNMSGYRYKLECSLPDLPLIKLYRELGGEIITVGSDAHVKEFIGTKFDSGYELIKQAGFNYVTTFRDRKPSFEKL